MGKLMLCALLAALPAAAQVAELKHRLDKLGNMGRVLMIAAHPDDENTAFLAYCAMGRHYRAAYLSLTRGEGGQNLIGSEQGDLLGVIRTNELLAARRIDGAEQYFTRAIDFGFSKTAEETLAKWGKEEVLGDVVERIRRFRPDVIVLRFSGTPRDGHGHHQSSAMLGREAFLAAADPKRFPDRGAPWQAKRLLWNGFSFSRQQEDELEKMPKRLKADLGEFDALLGLSYGELAGMSRSEHRSQGMGAGQRRGSLPNYLFHVEGAEAAQDFMDGIDTSWKRVPGGVEVEQALARVTMAFDAEHPERMLPALVELRRRIAAIRHPDAADKLREADEAIALAAGLWLDASAATAEAVRGQKVDVTLTVVSRLAKGITLAGVDLDGMPAETQAAPAATPLDKNTAVVRRAGIRVPDHQPFTQPYWLAAPKKGNLYGVPPADEANHAPLRARFRLVVEGETVEIVRPVENRYVDRVRGELTRPFVVVPPVTVRITSPSLIFPSAAAKQVTVEARALADGASMPIRLKAPAGWRVEPAEQAFTAKDKGETRSFVFTVTPPAAAGAGELSVEGGTEVARVDYDHIPPQVIPTATSARAVRSDIRIAARNIGYVMGAGDEVPEALRQLGCDVTPLTAADLGNGSLSRFDAIVTGVRAWNVRDDLRANYQRIWDYAQNGGTVVVQYNILEGTFFGGDTGALKNIGPFPVKMSRDRVTVEEAPVRVLLADHPLLNAPNRIGAADFDGWIQERGLYFPGAFDERYESPLEMNDPGEKPLRGGLLAAKTGKGMYIITPLAFFRELPAGVPGAYRLFANLVSGGRAK